MFIKDIELCRTHLLSLINMFEEQQASCRVEDSLPAMASARCLGAFRRVGDCFASHWGSWKRPILNPGFEPVRFLGPGSKLLDLGCGKFCPHVWGAVNGSRVEDSDHQKLRMKQRRLLGPLGK